MSNDPAAREVIKSAVERSSWDPAFFLRFFLSHWFPSEIPPFHMGLLALMTGKVKFLNHYPYCHDFLLEYFTYEPDSRDSTAEPIKVFFRGEDGLIKMRRKGPHLNEVIPRGFSKTTLCKGVSLYDIVTDPTMFAVFISATATHSETQVNDIKLELESNDKLIAGYGAQRASKSDPEKWTSTEIHLKCGSILIARGRGGQVRGLTFNGRRPNKIVLDDVEDEESVSTDTQREKTLNWFYSSVVPAGQLMEGALGEEWAQRPLQIISLGTLLGPACLVLSLTADEDFGTIRFGAKLDDNTMLWPYKMTEASYDKMRSRWQRVGKLAAFTREYDSRIRVDDDTIFPAIFIYQPTTRADLIAVSQALDPAISDKKRACDTALVVAGRRTSDGALWLLDEWGGIGMSPSDKIEAMFEMHLKWQTTHNGIEAVQYQAALLHVAREEMMRRKLFFHIEAIRQGSEDRKLTRIVGMLSPRYSNGALRHLRPLPKLESNLADWPNGKVDYADAAAMALSLLGETTGLVMDGALDPEPPIEGTPIIPELGTIIGNHLVRSRSGHDHRRAARYPVSASAN